MSLQVGRHPEMGSRPGRFPMRGRVGGAAVGLGLLLVVLGTVHLFATSTFVWVNRLIDHPYLLGAAGAVCVGFGLYCLLREVWQRVAAVPLYLGASLVWVLLVWFFTPFLSEKTLAVVPAPPSGDDYAVVVREVTDGWNDKAWLLFIRQQDGLFSREWSLGCISADALKDTYKNVAWEERSRLIVTTRARSVAVNVDPSTGRPQPMAGYPWNTCSL